MATLEKIRNEENQNIGRFTVAMPSRAKYFQSDYEIPAAYKTVQPSRFAGYNEQEEYRLGELKIENEELKKDINAGNPDILPTGATLKMLREGKAPAKPFDDTVAVSYRVNAKGKLFFALYAVAVLTLVLVIVLNALAIERQKVANTGLENEIAFLGMTVETLNGETESLNDAAYIQGQAESYGMKPVNTVNVTVKAPVFAQINEYKPVTNWFDSICDLLG